MSAQEKTQSDVKGQETPGQASSDRMHAQVTPEIQKTCNQERQHGMRAVGCPKKRELPHRPGYVVPGDA